MAEAPRPRRVSLYVRGTIYDVRRTRLCPKCEHMIEQGERAVADTDDRIVHYDPPCPADPAPLPIIPRPSPLTEFTFGMDWVGQPWHYLTEVLDHGYRTRCDRSIRPVREGGRVVDAPRWPSAYHCPDCERKGPPARRMMH